MATFNTHGDGRRPSTDWLGGGEGAPADDRVAGGQSTPDEVIRPMSDVISQLLSGLASDLEALRGAFDANRAGSLIDDDDDERPMTPMTAMANSRPATGTYRTASRATIELRTRRDKR